MLANIVVCEDVHLLSVWGAGDEELMLSFYSSGSGGGGGGMRILKEIKRENAEDKL